MLRSTQKLCSLHFKHANTIRHLTSTEVSTALRPFYFSVHPDLFGQYPNQQAINENSLQQLSSVLNSIQNSKPFRPTSLEFYIKNKTESTKVTFRLIKIHLTECDIRSVVLTILRSCQLSTDYVDKIAVNHSTNNRSYIRLNTNDIDFTNINKNHPIYAHTIFQRDLQAAKDALKLQNWLKKNYDDALLKLEKNRPFREDIDRLCKSISSQLGLKEIRWDCGWNATHFRGCLQSFKSLAEQHPTTMDSIKGRILVFSNFTGVSLDGHIMLYTGEVRNNWLDLIKNIKTHDASLLRIPAFEKSLSHVLRNIKVGRRKFMPKIVAKNYEDNLNEITTSLCDYRSTKEFPKQWPPSLSNYEIVVETEAGPLMVSPTGQFIVPCGLPGTILVNFITTNLSEADEKMKNYERDKHIERSLHKRVLVELELFDLVNQDNVTPDLMIKCCERLLEHKQLLLPYMKNINLSIGTYYSVLTDGMVCIPWNWVM